MHDLFTQAERLARQIDQASASHRLALQPQFSRAIARLKAAGEDVPMRLRRLDAALNEEALEDRFDNMPV